MSHLLTAAPASLSGSPAHCFSFRWLEIGVGGAAGWPGSMGRPSPGTAGACAAGPRRGGREPVYPGSGAGWRSRGRVYLGAGARSPRPPPCPSLVGRVIWRARARVRACARAAARPLGAGPTARRSGALCRPACVPAQPAARRPSPNGRALLSCLNPGGSQSVTYARHGLWLATASGSPHYGGLLMAASFGGAKVSERVKRPSGDPLPPFRSGARPPAAKSHPFSAPAVCQAPGQTLKT